MKIGLRFFKIVRVIILRCCFFMKNNSKKTSTKTKLSKVQFFVL